MSGFSDVGICDAFVFEPKLFGDERGYFFELYRESLFRDRVHGPFVQFNQSRSSAGVLRGLHLQIKKPQGKFVTVLRGKIFDVALDCRKNSKTFGKHFSIILSEDENTSLYIPEGFAHGFCSLSNNTVMHYKCTNYVRINIHIS